LGAIPDEAKVGWLNAFPGAGFTIPGRPLFSKMLAGAPTGVTRCEMAERTGNLGRTFTTGSGRLL
jgi:hypothetical protein